MAGSILLAAGLLGVLSLLAHFSQREGRWRVGFLVLAGLELVIFAWGNLPSFDISHWVSQQSDLKALYQKDPGDYRVVAESPNASLGTPALDLWGEDPAAPWRYVRFAVGSQGLDPQENALNKALLQKVSPALGMTRWRYRIGWEGDSASIQRTGLKEDPRFLWTSAYQVAGPEEVLAKTLDPRFDPTRSTFFEEDPGFPSAIAAGSISITAKDLDSDRIEIALDALRSGAVVISDNYAKGWRATGYPDSSQKEYRVLPANGFQRAVVMAPGHHHFMLEYRPAVFEVGKWISLLSWCFFVGGLLFFGLPARNPRGL
jgi:hypothetical protein